MEITNLRSGSKFILTETITVGNKVYPKGLVLCLVNLKILRSGKTAFFIVSKSKAITAKCYQNIAIESYSPGKSWWNWLKVKLSGSNFELIDLYFKPFDEEYDQITNTKPVI